MKFIPAQVAFFLQSGEARRNLKLLRRFLAVLLLMMIGYSVLFHFVMAYEGQKHSWLTGFYWTMTVMTTLGFGDITFHTDLGRLFSILVLVSGVLFLLVVLPFAFIQFFLAPWLEAQSRARAPRELPDTLENHVLLTSLDPVSQNLAYKLGQHKRRYALIVHDVKRALELHDQGFSVMVGDLDLPETYRLARIDRAAMIAATGNDMENTSITFTVRELSGTVPIVADVDHEDSIDILHLAGATHVFQYKAMLGQALAKRAIGSCARANIITQFGALCIAEASATRSPLVGKTIAETNLRQATGITIVGLWERGVFSPAGPETVIQSSSVLMLAGTQEQVNAFDELFCIYVANEEPVVILGGGQVALAAAKELEERGLDYRIVEKDPALATSPRHVLGSAADRDTLQRAGLDKAITAIVTTRDDDMNIYLTVYCRKLCPDLQIISRANLERNVSTLHRAGADFVMSYASMGANTILNLLEEGNVTMMAEGLDVFRMAVPEALAGRPLRECGIRERTGCHVVAVESGGTAIPNPHPDTLLNAADELILVADPISESRLAQLYPHVHRDKHSRVQGNLSPAAAPR